ncbi:MAG: N-(5'-phosphoribosyl)anthranilate isomerase [Verrucomicrobiales bacterium]|nr:N-(5'-phosphoribosyl)anthranilate isomerase [Verrucomicrobiales bacterium]
MTARTVFPRDTGRVAVKICGITSGDQASAIAEAGADAIGINFWPRSKRYISFEDALPWLNELKGVLPRVAVTVNATDDELLALYESGGLDWLQLHGDETAERVASLLEKGLPVFKAIGVRDRDTLVASAEFPGSSLLLDAYAPSEYGGSGHTMDWALGAEAVSLWPERQVILAGGLKPENVAEAIEQVHPAAVDVASGVESAPGVKDLALVKRFLEATHSASPS